MNGLQGFLDTLRLAEARTEAQAWPEAAPLWERLVAVNPVRGESWYQLGRVYFNVGNHRLAIPAFERALALGAGSPSAAAWNIARSYATLGERQRAFDWLERALDLGFRDAQSAYADSAFAPWRTDPRFRRLAGVIDSVGLSRTQGWRHDLTFLRREVRRMHARMPHGPVREAAAEAEIARLHTAVPQLSNEQLIVGVMRALTQLEDGHSELPPGGVPAWGNRTVPLQFFRFEEGLYVIAAESTFADLVGGRVVRVGPRDVDSVLALVASVSARDNPRSYLRVVPWNMRFPQLLHALGVVPDAETMPLTVVRPDGSMRTMGVPARTMPADYDRISGHPAWRYAYDGTPGPLPLHMQRRREPYWFQHLPAARTVYFQYNRVRNNPREPFAPFVKRLFDSIRVNDVDRLVIDLRWNNGGNSALLPPLITAILKNDRVNRRGHLFVIIGRHTFSAAANATAFLDRHTNALFVGEPASSSPNFVGESNNIVLPYSRLSVGISDLYWQSSWPYDRRTWVPPLVYLPPTFAAYRDKQDPALEAILAYREGLGTP